MRKKNCEEAPDRFPTNGIKYETKDINYQHESSLKNKELQKEIKRLQGVLEKVRPSLTPVLVNFRPKRLEADMQY